MYFCNLMVKKYYTTREEISASVAKKIAYKEYDKFKNKQDKLYKSDFDNFLNEGRMIENGSDK